MTKDFDKEFLCDGWFTFVKSFSFDADEGFELIQQWNHFYYIYKITCAKNGKSYIGRTVSPYSRIKAHYSELLHNRHKNERLQNDFNKYGADSFYFEVLDKTKNPKDESLYQAIYKTYSKKYGYNDRDCVWRNLSNFKRHKKARRLIKQSKET